MKLNLGSSNDHKQGYQCVDFPHPCCTKCSCDGMGADLRERWPWADSSVDSIYAKDVAEHIGNGYRLLKCFGCLKCGWETARIDGHILACPECHGKVFINEVNLIPYNGMIHFLNEAHRILRPGAVMELIVPCYWRDAGEAAFCDPTHGWPVWTSSTRYYFDERWNNDSGERGRLGPTMAQGITALFRTLPESGSGVDWHPIKYAPDAPERRKLFLMLQAVK